MYRKYILVPQNSLRQASLLNCKFNSIVCYLCNGEKKRITIKYFKDDFDELNESEIQPKRDKPEALKRHLRPRCSCYSERHLNITLALLYMSMKTSFPNLARLAAILIVLPVTTATVERTFSSMKLIKT